MGEGCRPSPVLPETNLRFQLRLSYLPVDLSWVFGILQSCGSKRPLQGILSEREYPCATHSRHRPIDIDKLPDCPAHTVVEGSPAGPEVIEPLELLVLDHADPAGQYAFFPDTMGLLEHPLVRPESSLGDGLVARISNGEPAARQVPDTTLDSLPMDGITYLEHLAPGVSLDSGPMEGMSCLEPLEQLWIYCGLHDLQNVFWRKYLSGSR